MENRVKFFKRPRIRGDYYKEAIRNREGISKFVRIRRLQITANSVEDADARMCSTP